MSRMSHTAKAIRYAITGALACGLLTGCAGSSSRHLAKAGDYAARSGAQQDSAIDAAENTVARDPNDAAARRALGQAYLDAGRFESAATTFGDAIALGDESGRTRLSLALARIGAGDRPSAVAVLDEARDAIPAADRGLALALAGETGRGVAILLDALRGGENTPKMRQNLAFAFALDGRWREARIAMAQDVPADKINDRIGEWAAMARPEDVQRRVATLLAVPLGVADPGQPVALALGAVPQDARFAAAEPADAELAPIDAAPGPQTASAELPPLDPAPAEIAPPARYSAAPAFAPAAVPASASFSAAFAAPQADVVSQPVVQAIPAPPAYRAPRTAHAAAPVLAPKAPRRAVAAVSSGQGTHLVQLGSFSSEANARRAVDIFTARDPELRNRTLTITPAVVNGRNFWRVAASAHDGGSALRLCSSVKSRGGACFAYARARAPAGGQPQLAIAVSASGRARSR